MDELSLSVPESIVESLPADGDDAAHDMERTVAGYEHAVNEAIGRGDDEAASVAVDVLERLENRMDQYDAFVAELRAWGQSPIYAVAWRDLCGALVGQIYDHEGLAERLDRERHARLVEDGIRPGRD